jgi:hypothetical protein
MNLCLSRDEIAELTRAQTRKRQAAFLRANGVRHYIDANGWPVVTRAAVEGGKESEQHGRGWKPNKAA